MSKIEFEYLRNNFTSNFIGFDYDIQLTFRFLVFDLTYLYYGWSNTIVFV